MPVNQQSIHPDEERLVLLDLIGIAPSWLLKSGISMIAVVFMTILFVASFIQYPDKIKGTGILTSATPPIELVATTNGYIEKVLATDGKKVRKNDRLFYIMNTTNPRDINILKNWITQFESVQKSQDYLSMTISSNLQLGALQTDYAGLILRFNELQKALGDSLPFIQIHTISEEVNKIHTLNNSQQREKKIFSEELLLEKSGYERNQSLLIDSVISKLELEQAKTKYLQKQRTFESMENTIIQNNIRIKQLEMEMLKIKGDHASQLKSTQFELNEIIARIKANISDWDKTYHLIAPIAGTLSIKSQFHQNAVVKENDVLGHVLPSEYQQKYFVCNIPIFNAGKLEVDQKAIIKLDAFPYKEFGMINGEVKHISRIPDLDNEGNSFYQVKIPIADSTYTETGNYIPNRPGMTAQLEIITKEKTILERIFNQFLSLLNKS